MKKLNFGGINAGLEQIKELVQENATIGHAELIDAERIDFSEKNTFAADDTDESIRELADSIKLAGLLHPLSVVQNGDRYTLISGERRYKAIKSFLGWEKIPCNVFDGADIDGDRQQLMLHMANQQREIGIGRQLEIFEEYSELLERLRENGVFTGKKLEIIASKMKISERQARKYRAIAEHLSATEKQSLAAGEMTVNEASRLAHARAAGDAESSSEKSIEEMQDAELSSEERGEALKNFILLGRLWNPAELYRWYCAEMPTPKEAIERMLRPKAGIEETLGRPFPGFNYRRTPKKLIVDLSGRGEYASYSYAEVDAAVRELYRKNYLEVNEDADYANRDTGFEKRRQAARYSERRA